MFFWDDFEVTLSRCKVLGGRLRDCQLILAQSSVVASLELVAKRLVIEEDPRILILAIPLILQLSHTLHEARKLRVPDQANECSSRLG